MWGLFLYLRLVSSSLPVLVLSDRKYQKLSPIVVTYMITEDIPMENWKDYGDWTGDCKEEGGQKRSFKKVYLWEGVTRWICEGEWKRKWRKWFSSVEGLHEKLEACNNIIEINIDGCPFNEDRIPQDEKLMQKYANSLVNKLKETTKTNLKITWYDNCGYGMDWKFGPHQGYFKFTWKKVGIFVEPGQEPVIQQTYLWFWTKLIEETCKNDGKCFGILAAYSDSTLISCDTVLEKNNDLRSECSKSYKEYKTESGPKEYETSNVDEIEPLVVYLKMLKGNRKEQKIKSDL